MNQELILMLHMNQLLLKMQDTGVGVGVQETARGWQMDAAESSIGRVRAAPNQVGLQYR